MVRNLDKYLLKLKPKCDDDVVDRCNYLLTNIMLLICAITVAAKQYVGEPLQCWVPAEFQPSWEQYIENFCFVESTYFVPFADDMPMDTNEHNQRQIQYYQWIPFILILQSLLFLIPRTIWITFNWRTGINMQAIVDATILTRKVGKKRYLRKATMEHDELFAQAQEIAYVMDFNQKKSQYAKLIVPLRQIYVTALYLFCKSLNVLNIIVQLYLLNRFLGMQYQFWGFGVLSDLIHGRQWSISGNFPRVTFCDVTVREIGNTNRKTVQCVLMINMFNEKIFLALWFWLMALGILTILNLTYWIAITFVPSYSKNFVSSFLTFRNIQLTENDLNYFLSNSAGKDAITVLHLVSDHAGELVAADLFAALWSISCETKNANKSETDHCLKRAKGRRDREVSCSIPGILVSPCSVHNTTSDSPTMDVLGIRRRCVVHGTPAAADILWARSLVGEGEAKRGRRGETLGRRRLVICQQQLKEYRLNSADTSSARRRHWCLR
uniref:Innexin n=1 Tax=Setaria digitata TaxID=48799 RepID=A0A915PIC2_9BILA